MNKRIEQELALLCMYFSDVDYIDEGQWFLIRNYPVPPEPSWGRNVIDVCFNVSLGYPGTAPYGFCVPIELKCGGLVPNNNYNPNPPTKPPFKGEWGFFSWSHDSTWRVTVDLKSGSNLSNFARTFYDRLKEGV